MRDSGSQRGPVEQQRRAGTDREDQSVTKKMLLTPLLSNGAFPLLNLALCLSQVAGTAHAETEKAAATQPSRHINSLRTGSLRDSPAHVPTHFSQTSAESLVSRLARHLV